MAGEVSSTAAAASGEVSVVDLSGESPIKSSAQVDLRGEPDSPQTNDRALTDRPVISKFNPFSHFLDDTLITDTFHDFMDLVNHSLAMLFKDAPSPALGFRRKVCDLMVEYVMVSDRLHTSGLLSQGVLKTLKHRSMMNAEIVDWFITEMCRACNIKCAAETSQGFGIKCENVARCPFTLSKVDNIVVWGTNLFNKMYSIQSGESESDVVRQTRFIRQGFKDSEFGLYVQCRDNHFTNGVIHNSMDRRLSITWRCSMQEHPQEEVVEKVNRCILVCSQHLPEWTIIKTPKQRPNECPSRSLLDLADNMLHISRGGTVDPLRLARDSDEYEPKATKNINNDADNLRVLISLALFKCMAAVGMIDFQTAWEFALSNAVSNKRKAPPTAESSPELSPPYCKGELGNLMASPATTKRLRRTFAGARGSDIQAQQTSVYVPFPLHRVLVVRKIYWTAFLYQHKLVEFRIRSSLQPGMSLLFSLDAFERRLGNTDLLLAKVKEVCTLPMEEAITRFPAEAADCNLRKMCTVWGRTTVVCIVVEKPRLASEFVFLVSGNLGEMRQFSVKNNNPQFCLKADEGKLVTITDKSGKTVKREMLNIFACHSDCCHRVSRPAAGGDIKGTARHQTGEDGDSAVAFLDYEPKTRSGRPIACRRLIPRQQQYNLQSHGTITGNVQFTVGTVLHRYFLTRHVHATRKEGSCGFITVEVDSKNAVSDVAFMEAFESRAPVAANRLRDIADLSEDDDLVCFKLRRYLCGIMLVLPKDRCNNYWEVDPEADLFLDAQQIANSHCIEVPDSFLTRGQKWAVAILSSAIQFDDGYRRVLSDHLEGSVGFITVQKRLWSYAAMQIGTRGNSPAKSVVAQYGHSTLNNYIPVNACAMWVMCHIVADDDECGDTNHFEVITTGQSKPLSSLFMIDQYFAETKQRNGVQVPSGGSTDTLIKDSLDVRKQASIYDYFRKYPQQQESGCEQDHIKQESSSQQDHVNLSAVTSSEQGQETQGLIQQIRECLSRGSQMSSSADTAVRICCNQCQVPGKDKHQSLKGIIKNLQPLKGRWNSLSVEAVQEHVQRYVDTLIFVSNLAQADERMVKQRPPLHAMLEWILTIITPGGSTKIASDQKQQSWRQSICSLLQISAPSEMSLVPNSSEPECCFKCSGQKKLRKKLRVWGCCRPNCRIGYCVECMGMSDEREPAGWCCKSHSVLSKLEGILPRHKSLVCWECPRDPETSKASEQTSCLACTVCGLRLCRMHAILAEDQEIVRFRCWVCSTRVKFADGVRTKLRRLLAQFTKFPHDAQLSNFTSEQICFSKLGAGSSGIKAVYRFANLVYDAHNGTLCEVAEDFIPVLMQVNVGMISKFDRAPSHPSQWLRMLGGTETTVQGGPKFLQAISECTARELVAQNGSVTGARWVCWENQPVKPKDGLLTMGIWMPFGSRCCPEVDLLAAIFTCLEERKNELSSIVLCCRRLTGAQSDEESYDKDHGPCSKLIEHFSKKGKIKWFSDKDGPDQIYSFFIQMNFDVVCSIAGYCHGEAAAVLAKQPRVAPLIVEMTAYAGFMWGIADFVWANSKLNHYEHWNSSSRERAIINENPYPALGWHNGHFQPSEAEIARMQLPAQGRSVLLFSGSLDKLSRATVHLMCRILTGTGNGPKSSILAVIGSTDLGVDSVRKWIEEYNSKVFENDKITADRLWIFPYRRKELFWAFLYKIRYQCLSISTCSHYDVHTTAGDAIVNFVSHLALRAKNQMWQRNVAALLVEQVGLEQYLIAEDEENLVQRAIWWLLNPHMLRAASEHMEKCQEEQLGYYYWMRMVEDMEKGIPLAFAQVVQAEGDRQKLLDIDLTKLETRPPPCNLFMPPGIAPGFIIGESCNTQLNRLLNQIKTKCLSFKGMDMLFAIFVELHHRLGFRNMCLVGHGSSTLCIQAAYRGEGISGAIAYGQESALKVPHFTGKNKLRQENRIRNDPIPTALYVACAADLRRNIMLQNILPKPMEIYSGSCAAGFVQLKSKALNQPSKALNQPARARPVLCFGAFEFVQERSFHDSPIIKKTVLEYHRDGVISDTMVRIIQAILFSIMIMNERQCINMDISWANLALREIKGRFFVTWLDTGGSIVIPKPGFRASGTPMMRCSTSVAAGPDEGPAKGLKPPTFSVCKETGIGYLSTSVIRDLYAQGDIGQHKPGTKFYRDERIAAELEDKSNKDKPLPHSKGCNIDLHAGVMCGVKMIRPHPWTSGTTWEQELAAAIESKDAMYEFLLNGTASGTVQQPHLLDALADMFYKCLRHEDRFTVRQALISKALSIKVWSAAQMQALQGPGISFPNGMGRCPVGSQWQANILPKLLLKEEIVSEASMGVGVQTLSDYKKGDFLGLYAGTDASSPLSVEEFPPCRYTTYATRNKETTRHHVVADQPVDWFLEHSVVGPFLNAAVGNEAANVELRRSEFWRDVNTGILYIAMYFLRDTKAGQFLHWSYDPFAGAGGIDAYRFPSD